MIKISKRFVISKTNLLLCFLYLTSFLYLFPSVEKVGFIGLLMLLLAPIIVTFYKRAIGINIITLFWVTIIAYNIFLLIKGDIKSGIYNCLLQILIISFVICFQNISVSKRNITSFASFMHHIGIILAVYNLLLLILSPHIGIDYSTYKYAMRTIMYPALIIGLFREEFNQKQLLVRIFLIGAMMFLFTERSMALGMIIFLLVYVILNKQNKPKKHNVLFISFVVLVLLIPIGYIALYKSSFANDLNLLIYKITNKNFFSGRQVLWENAIDMIKDKWLFGYGYGDFLFNYGLREMSVHNIYLFILLQGGLCNLILIIGFFYSVFYNLNVSENDYYSRLSAAFLLTMMFLGSFGLILFVNDILYSMMLWSCIGIGLVQKKDNLLNGD